MSGWRTSMCVAALATTGGRCGGSAVRRRRRDDVVLERLPEKGDPCARAAEADAQRRWRARPARSRHRDSGRAQGARRGARSSAIRASSARRRRRSRRGGRPTTVPPAALLLRATLKQSQHDFDGSLTDLDRLLAAQPARSAGAADARDGARRPGPLRRCAPRLRRAERPRSADRFPGLRRGAGEPVGRCGWRVRRA